MAKPKAWDILGLDLGSRRVSQAACGGSTECVTRSSFRPEASVRLLGVLLADGSQPGSSQGVIFSCWEVTCQEFLSSLGVAPFYNRSVCSPSPFLLASFETSLENHPSTASSRAPCAWGLGCNCNTGQLFLRPDSLALTNAESIPHKLPTHKVPPRVCFSGNSI